MFNNKNLLRSMKKMTFIVCAAMLASAVLFTGCKKDQNEPSKAPQVQTDIAISLPGQVGASGAFKMPGRTVQDGTTGDDPSAANDFLSNGMNGITLVPFGPSAEVTTSSVRLGDNIVLGAIEGTQNYTKSPNGRAKVFTGKSVPTGTSAFLFYGESGKTGTDFEKGVLTASLTGEPAAFTFSLKPIQSNVSTITGNAAYTGLIAYLNAVANASDGVKAWKNYTSSDNEGLYEMFQKFSTVTVLSSFGIRRMMEDLYESLISNTSDAMAQAIKAAIADATYATVTTPDPAKPNDVTLTLVSSLQGFPASVNLPDGAVAVAYDATVGVEAFDGNAAHAYGGLEPAQLNRYVYAPSLWYTANTKIKTSNTTKAANYTGAESWKAILATYEKDNSSVNTATRSIALKDTVQYAVGRLDVKVKFKENTYLVDNDPVPANNRVDNPIAGYPVSAILVGGQKNVGFDFTSATYSGSTAYEQTIYDNVMTRSVVAKSTTDYSDANSTLVLETAANVDEFVALEFTNTSNKDFYGVDGIVPVGGKFYLVGKLLASAASETGNKVFKQDYTTTVRVAIKDLKSAYNTIPDLKAPQLEIGLSVDLEWRAGHTYDLEL